MFGQKEGSKEKKGKEKNERKKMKKGIFLFYIVWFVKAFTSKQKKKGNFALPKITLCFT